MSKKPTKTVTIKAGKSDKGGVNKDAGKRPNVTPPAGKPKGPYRQPPVEHQFKPGNKANPLGAGAHNQELKALKKITHETIREIIEIALNGTLKDLVEVAQDPKSSALQVGIATSLANAVKKGDFNTVGAIVTKLTGEAPKKFDFTTNGKDLNQPTVTKVLLQLPANGRTKEETEKKK